MDFSDIKLYPKKSFADVLKEIHTNTQEKEKEIKELINNLKPLIVTAGDAVIVVPLITSYLQTAVKNDDNLIKMAGIVQRAINAGKTNENGDIGLSEDEKEQLLKSVQNLTVA